MAADRPALDGLRVLELGSFIAGPFAGQLLGDLGADVVKVEPPETGDPMRRWGVLDDGRSLWWPSIARNKRSVAVNLRDERGRDVVRRIAEHVDVVLENFKPGTLERWGLGYEALAAANPAVVLVHVSGYGQTGPRAHEPGFGAIGEAVGGIRFTTGEADRPPARAGISLGDSLAALFAVIGTLTALHERHRSGRGQEVDVAIAEAVFALMESTVADYELGGVVRTRSGGVLQGCRAVERVPDRRRPRRRDRGERRRGLRPSVRCDGSAGARDRSRGTRSTKRGARVRSSSTPRSRAGARSTPPTTCSRSSSGTRCRAGSSTPRRTSPPTRSSRRATWCCGSRPASTVRCPMAGVVPKLSRTPGAVRSVGPALGEHTDVVLRELAGLTDDELASPPRRRTSSPDHSILASPRCGIRTYTTPKPEKRGEGVRRGRVRWWARGR